MRKKYIFLLCVFVFFSKIKAEGINSYLPDPNTPTIINGMKLVWSDEFEMDGPPNPVVWKHENGFLRNQELQWYQPANAHCSNGSLKIEGRREKITNPNYVSGSSDWTKNREYANYSASSITTSDSHSWLYGRFEVRAKIPAVKGAWPAIWTLGINKEWPSNGEVDLMEFYRINNVPSILANAAWGTNTRWVAKWDGSNKPLTHFTSIDSDWANKFHIWRMDWDKDFIRLYLDDELLNEVDLSQTINQDGFNPFHQPQYLLLNLALGGNGGDPTQTIFPIVYEIDYVRIYQKVKNASDIKSIIQTNPYMKILKNANQPKIQLNFPKEERISIKVYNMDGTLYSILIHNELVNAGEKIISLKGLNPQLYLISLEMQGHRYLEKLLVNS